MFCGGTPSQSVHFVGVKVLPIALNPKPNVRAEIIINTILGFPDHVYTITCLKPCF